MIRPEALVVDDEHASLVGLAGLLEAEGWEVRTAADLASARRELRLGVPDLVLCDLLLPDGDGTELLGDLESHPHVEAILVTGNATVPSAVEALRRGAYDYLTKPVDIARLRAILSHLERGVALRQDVAALRRQLREMGRFGDLVGSSRAMQEVFDLIERVAPTDTKVLLAGASGTGKEIVAETIHRLSLRSRQPFVPVNCGAVSPQLIESELFGHEKGSFTGAERRHRGVFERAHGGTLFLDEITEMSHDLQVKLLRALENESVRPVGADHDQRIDVRVIAATNRDPELAASDGTLRQDLYFRLSVFPIRLPPLAARGDDVKLLAVHFLNQICRSAGVAKEFDADALDVLLRHDWPGNVRELRNVVERAFIMARDVVDVGCLPAELRGGGGGRVSLEARAPAGTPLEEVVRRHTLATLDHFGGNKRRTARALGISVKTLYNRLERYRSQRSAEPGAPSDD